MKILRCPKCSKYTLDELCGACGIQTHTPEPAKYSPQDPWGAYRRKMKTQENECS